MIAQWFRLKFRLKAVYLPQRGQLFPDGFYVFRFLVGGRGWSLE
jgi:hypothetical protein